MLFKVSGINIQEYEFTYTKSPMIKTISNLIRRFKKIDMKEISAPIDPITYSPVKNPHNHRNFENELCVSYITKLHRYSYDTAYSQLPYHIHDWLNRHIGKDNFDFGFEDYGQHGEWILYTRSKEDLLAFTIVWSR